MDGSIPLSPHPDALEGGAVGEPPKAPFHAGTRDGARGAPRLLKTVASSASTWSGTVWSGRTSYSSAVSRFRPGLTCAARCARLVGQRQRPGGCPVIALRPTTERPWTSTTARTGTAVTRATRSTPTTSPAASAHPSISTSPIPAAANSAAVFHSMAGPDDEVLPCIELAGILGVAYLDADMRAVRVSVWGRYPRPAIRRCVRGGRPAARPVRSGAAGSGVIDTALSFHAAGVVRARSTGRSTGPSGVAGRGCGAR